MTCTLSIGLLCCLSGTLPKPVLGCDCDLSRDVLLRNEYCTAETRNALRSCIALRREGKEDEANQATTQLLARLPLDGVIGGDYWCVRQYQLIQAENRGDFRAVLDGYVDWIAATGSDEIAYWLAERAGKHRRPSLVTDAVAVLQARPDAAKLRAAIAVLLVADARFALLAGQTGPESVARLAAAGRAVHQVGPSLACCAYWALGTQEVFPGRRLGSPSLDIYARLRDAAAPMEPPVRFYLTWVGAENEAGNPANLLRAREMLTLIEPRIGPDELQFRARWFEQSYVNHEKAQEFEEAAADRQARYELAIRLKEPTQPWEPGPGDVLRAKARR